MAEKLPPLDLSRSITDSGGRPTVQFQTWWQTLIAAVNAPLSVYPLKSVTVTTLPNVLPAGRMVYVTNESGGAQPAVSDGANFRRLTDRAIVS